MGMDMLCPWFILIFRGENAEFVLEVFTEILGVVESQLIGNLGYGELTFRQVLGRSFKSQQSYELYGGLAGKR